jgi:hypothetical protein
MAVQQCGAHPYACAKAMTSVRCTGALLLIWGQQAQLWLTDVLLMQPTGVVAAPAGAMVFLSSRAADYITGDSTILLA